MRTDDINRRAMRGELTAADAADIAGANETSLTAWPHDGRGVALRPWPNRRNRSTQVDHAVKLYRERYGGLTLSAFRRVLSVDHEMSVPVRPLRDALRREGLLPVQTPEVAPPPFVAESFPTETRSNSELEQSEPEDRPNPSPEDVQLQVARELQSWSDRIDRLNSAVRDQIVRWRRGERPVDAAVDAFAELKTFVLGVPRPKVLVISSDLEMLP